MAGTRVVRLVHGFAVDAPAMTSEDLLFPDRQRLCTAELDVSGDVLVAELVRLLDRAAAAEAIDPKTGLLRHGCAVFLRVQVLLYQRELETPGVLNGTVEAQNYPSREIRVARLTGFPYALHFPRDPWAHCK